MRALQLTVGFLVLAVEYLASLPRLCRRAWCELSGGHKSIVLGAFSKDRCWAFRLYCERCDTYTRWFDVPKRES